MDEKIISALLAEYKRLLQDLPAIEAVLRREGRLPPKAGGGDSGQDDLFVEAPTPGESIANEKTNGTGGKSGLRQVITDVLESSSRGLRPIEVTSRLQEVGFNAGDNLRTPLKVRVAGEMSRMKSNGQLRKTRAGLYRVN